MLTSENYLLILKQQHVVLYKKSLPYRYIVIQYTPDNSNLQGTDENGSS